MGHNRGGDKRRLRLRRRHKEDVRLARKAAAKPPGLAAKVKDLAKGVVEKVGEAVQTVKEKVTGHP
jgi:hypothetical protein